MPSSFPLLYSSRVSTSTFTPSTYGPHTAQMPPYRPPRAASVRLSASPIPSISNRAKRTNDTNNMPLFTRSQTLTANPNRTDEIEAFLSSEVEVNLEDSFASNMSLNSPPQSKRAVNLPSVDDSLDYIPMDISPAPQRILRTQSQAPKYDGEERTSRESKAITGRPRSNTSSGGQRLFGKDVSNSGSSRPSGASAFVSKAGEKEGKGLTEKGSKKLQRAALPFEWLQPEVNTSSRDPIMSSVTKPMDISSPAADAMEIDLSFQSMSSSAPEPPSPLSAAPTITQFNIHSQLDRYDGSSESASAGPRERTLSNLFYDTMSPRRRSTEGVTTHLNFGEVDLDVNDTPDKPAPKKKRSISPQPQPAFRKGLLQQQHLFDDESLSSPAQMSSPSIHKLERLNSKPALRSLGLGDPLGLNVNNKRPRRPVLSAMVPAGSMDGMLRSAYPQMESGSQDKKDGDNKPKHSGDNKLPPVRRAFSAMIPASLLDQSFTSDGDNSVDGPDMSSPAVAYAKRQQVKTIRRCDGTDDFRSITGASALLKRDDEVRHARKKSDEERPSATAERDTPRSKYLTGLGGFGDNEANGKILPCKRVKEDGLMRIDVKTMNDLLDGKYDSKISTFQVIDCRFDYEYDGGHIPGAININTTSGVEEYLLGAGVQKPKPSISGDSTQKMILVFHCEFSCKRAPTFAKHLRAKDRSLNNHVYPRIHYPEVYVLEGGYCQYYKQSGQRCEPMDYVTMDDPRYAMSRKEDLDLFRKGKFGRAKSYAYGEGKNSLTAAMQQPKRGSAPVSGGSASTMFVAGNAARSRRTQGMLQTLQEDSSLVQQSEDEDTDVGDSPCPPPTKGVSFKGKKMPRAPLTRAESYGFSKMTLGH